MKLLHHVKKHWKTITLHLKKHHKKYIFWILSATLLWKWIGLIATYAVIHHVSFSFADIIHNGWENEQIIETEIVEEETINDEWNSNNNEEEDNDILNKEETTLIEEWANDENDDTNNGETIDSDNWEIIDNDNWETDEEVIDEEVINEEVIDEENTDEWDQTNWNWICDLWDINITNPKQWDITWQTFDISREFTNDDCSNNSYIIKLRDQNDQYLDIFSGDKNETRFNFDSTQLVSWFYDITWSNESWEIIILHEWIYAWIQQIIFHDTN